MASSGKNQSHSLGISILEKILSDSIRKNPASKLTGKEFEYLPAASVCLIVREISSATSPEILLLQRNVSTRDPWSGQMAFPGGRSRPGETAEETVIREVSEETKIDLSSLELLSLNQVVPGNLSIKVSPFVAFLHQPVDVEIDGVEIVEYFWIPISYFMDQNNLSIHTITRDGTTFQVPAFIYQDKHVIWGMTLAIIRDFLLRIH
ncbi:MAG: CoA pyrophosphatase [Thaumarchaeota archaeon]|nr:CoA pyrophosphatase [Nitrososphaerota archaeon]